MQYARIENWQYFENVERLAGNVYGHPLFIEGELVTTSRVEHIDTEVGVAITRNTTYVLGLNDEQSKTSLQYLADGLAILDRAQSYLYSRTYTSDGAGCRTWGTWFDDVTCAVTELHKAGDEIRQAIAYQIQAKLY